MSLRSGYLFVVGLLVVVQLATAFTAIGLLTRMSPAVDRILVANVRSNEAAESMISALALHAAGTYGTQAKEFHNAIAIARQNVTEDEERAVIDTIENSGHEFLAGDTDALETVILASRQLIDINQAAMRRADLEAQRLGTTGAWAAVVLSLFSFFVSLFSVRNTVLGVIEPIEEVETVLDAFRKGDSFRRCQSRSASPEMRKVLGSINTLLDRAGRIEEVAPAPRL